MYYIINLSLERTPRDSACFLKYTIILHLKLDVFYKRTRSNIINSLTFRIYIAEYWKFALKSKEPLKNIKPLEVP